MKRLLVGLCLLCFLTAAQAQKKPVTGSPCARRLARVHKVFLGTTGGTPNDINQRFYDELVSNLSSTNGYQLVDDPAQAELILYISAEEWQAHLSMLDPSTHVIVWTLGFNLTGWHSGNIFERWSGSEPKAAKAFSEDLKALASAAI